jgi:PilZ domain-containing protein
MSSNNGMTDGDQKRVKRRDARIEVAWNVACEKTVEIEQTLPAPLERVYERVHADPSDKGKRFAATLRDLSVNGAFLEGEPLPLLSRVVMVIDVPAFRQVEAVGWVLWRRTAPCTITRPSGAPVTLGAGFGIVFEWISLEARLEIARRVALLA